MFSDLFIDKKEDSDSEFNQNDFKEGKLKIGN